MTERTLLETPPYTTNGKFTDDAAFDKWAENGIAVVAYHIGWSGGGYGFDTESEVKEAWPACPGDNWTEAEHCEDARRILADEGKELHGDLTYRSVLTNSIVCGPDRTKDGWVLVGSCSAGSTAEVQVDDENTMRYVDIEGTISVYECPTEFEVHITQCLPDYLPRGADATQGEVLVFAAVNGESTLEDVLDGLEESLRRDAWEDLPAGSDEAVVKAIQETIASDCGIKWSEDEGFNADDLKIMWDDSLSTDCEDGPNVYVLVKPAATTTGEFRILSQSGEEVNWRNYSTKGLTKGQ